MNLHRILLIGGILIAAILAWKFLKQLISLSLSLLSLKVVWIALIIFIVVMSLKKRRQSPRETHEQ